MIRWVAFRHASANQCRVDTRPVQFFAAGILCGAGPTSGKKRKPLACAGERHFFAESPTGFHVAFPFIEPPSRSSLCRNSGGSYAR